MRRLVGFLLGVLVIGLLVYAKSLPAMGPSVPAPDQNVPKNFWYHKDQLNQVIRDVWPTIKEPHTIGGLVEQETCISLTHRYCWSRFAELKTKHEHGIGLGQFTITKRFNAFEEVKALDPILKDWKEEDYFNANYQMRAILVKLRYNMKRFPQEPPLESWAFTLAAYNGGLGGILKDQRLCKNTTGCNPNLWFGHVENTSLKTRLAFNGFQKSAYQINREYPQNILFKRRGKYEPFILLPLRNQQ